MTNRFNKHVLLGDTYFSGKLKNGMRVIAYKRDIYNIEVSLNVKFGIGNSAYKTLRSDETVYLPSGTAHFLEHAMFFGNHDGIMFNIDAYTTKTHTTYTISSDERENIQFLAYRLFNFVFNPNFTVEAVENEKKVIYQENSEDLENEATIDAALSVAYANNNLFRGLKDGYGVKNGDIEKITVDLLNDCHRVFYHPENMVLVAIGDFEPEDFIEKLEIYFKDKVFPANIRVPLDLCKQEEIEAVKEINLQRKHELAKSCIVLKANNLQYHEKSIGTVGNYSGKLATRIALDMICVLLFGRNGILQNQLVDENYIQSNIHYSINVNDSYMYLLLLYSNRNYYKRTTKIIINTLNKIAKKGISNKLFIMAKRMLYSSIIRTFDDFESLATVIVQLDYMGLEIADYIQAIINFEKSDMINYLAAFLENSSIYVAYEA